MSVACNHEPVQEPPAPIVQDTTVDVAQQTGSTDTISTSAPVRVIRWQLVPLTDSLAGWCEQSPYSSTLLALNRMDLRFLPRQDSILLPDTLSEDLMLYTPFPREVPALLPVKKFLLFSYPLEAFAAYQNGKLLCWGPVSMGKQTTPTPQGLLHTNWKVRSKVSTDNPEWILNWYFNIVNHTGSSLHQYELPGYPASHSCIRLRESDAVWIYRWADSWLLSADERTIKAYGTPLIVFGSYPFGERAPWKNLAADPLSNHVSVDSVEQVLSPFLSEMLQQQAQRDSLTAPADLP